MNEWLFWGLLIAEAYAWMGIEILGFIYTSEPYPYDEEM